MGFMKGGATNIKAIPENCIILNDGSLECKDSLTNQLFIYHSINHGYENSTDVRNGLSGLDTAIEFSGIFLIKICSSKILGLH